MNLNPLGDQGILAAFATEAQALAFAAAVRAIDSPDILDVVSAYASVAVFHDATRTTVASLQARLQALPHEPSSAAVVGRLHAIPCCYELGPDLGRVAGHCRLTPSEVIDRHVGSDYAVHAIGFCPGFPYLGYLPEALSGVPRLSSPRLRVEAGSVGLTGRQTGIYPLPRPGGWNIIGLTPLELVSVEDGYFPLHTGDRVRFTPIDRHEYERLRGTRLG